MKGIYKILSPTGKVYIGQSWDIEKRWRSHRSTGSDCVKLSNSLRKHGIGLHEFKVVHELPNDVEQETLNIYEQLYMDAYRDAGVELLNLREGGSYGTHSAETRKIISEKGKGRKMSAITKEKLLLRLKGHKYNVGKKRTDETKKRMSESLKGRVFSQEHRKNIRKSKEGAKCYLFGINPAEHPLAKKIICIATGVNYGTVAEAAKANGLKRSTLSMCLTGKNINKTGLTYDTQ